MRRHVKRFLGTALFFLAWLVLGAVGYVKIEGWTLQDSLYMTVITLTAVGYEEVHPLSGPGRIFTSFVLAAGITGMGLWFAFLTSALDSRGPAGRPPDRGRCHPGSLPGRSRH